MKCNRFSVLISGVHHSDSWVYVLLQIIEYSTLCYTCYLWQHGLILKHNKTNLYSTLQKENYTVPCSHQVTPFSLLSKLLKLALIKVTICVSSQVSGQLFPLSWLLCSTRNGLYAFFSEALSVLDSGLPVSWFIPHLLARFLAIPSFLVPWVFLLYQNY